MIYVTGDTHADARGEMSRFNTKNFPIQREMTKDDYVIICGDFGFIWSNEESDSERYWLNWLEDKPWTTLFIDGNHENFNRLDSYPVSEWNGGKVHFIRPSVIHLIRGQVFNLQGKTFATMGGAPSHDIQDGIFDPADYATKEELKEDIRRLEKRKGGWQFAMYRIKGVDWWEREQPSESEWAELESNMAAAAYKVDYILTHEAPASVIPFVGIHPATDMAKRLEEIRVKTDYKHFFFGHYHIDKYVNDKEIALYGRIIRIV